MESVLRVALAEVCASYEDVDDPTLPERLLTEIDKMSKADAGSQSEEGDFVTVKKGKRKRRQLVQSNQRKKPKRTADFYQQKIKDLGEEL